MLLLVLLVAGFGPASTLDEFPIVDELDIPKYLGRWYQPYASPFVLNTFERNGICVTATYGSINDTTLSVYNHQRKFTPDGTAEDILGVAFATDETGKLLVNFSPGAESGGGPYWVMSLGPVRTYGGVDQYSYSIISEPNKRGLYILCRDYDEYVENFEDETLEFCYNNGFNKTTNNPVFVYQGDDCLYPDLPEV